MFNCAGYSFSGIKVIKTIEVIEIGCLVLFNRKLHGHFTIRNKNTKVGTYVAKRNAENQKPTSVDQ